MEEGLLHLAAPRMEQECYIFALYREFLSFEKMMQDVV
jgi:hypothetical protein